MPISYFNSPQWARAVRKAYLPDADPMTELARAKMRAEAAKAQATIKARILARNGKAMV